MIELVSNDTQPETVTKESSNMMTTILPEEMTTKLEERRNRPVDDLKSTTDTSETSKSLERMNDTTTNNPCITPIATICVLG